MKCAICKNEIEGYGNNGKPLVNDLVCDNCNRFVIADRLEKNQRLDQMSKLQDKFIDLMDKHGDKSIKYCDDGKMENAQYELGIADGLSLAWELIEKEKVYE